VRQRLLQRLAREDATAPEIARLADALAAAARARECCDAERIADLERALALAWVQRLPWHDVDGDREVYRRSVDTIANGGTCHDRAVLLVATLRRLGDATAKVTWVTQRDAPENHVLVQWQTSRGWCYAGRCHAGWCWAETTIDGAHACEDPYAADRRVDGISGVAHGDLMLPKAAGQDVVTAQKIVAPSTSAPWVPRVAQPSSTPVQGPELVRTAPLAKPQERKPSRWMGAVR
jgi:hypothetical protein